MAKQVIEAPQAPRTKASAEGTKMEAPLGWGLGLSPPQLTKGSGKAS